MSEALLFNSSDVLAQPTPSAGYRSGEVIQLADGRAAVVQGLRALTSGEEAGLKTTGQHTLAKTANVAILKGDRVYWDRSAGTATPLRAMAGADFCVGVAIEDAAASATTVNVDLNQEPAYTIDIFRDPTETAIVKTAGAPTLSMWPGYAKALFDTTAEAQKVDILSVPSVPVDVPFIVEGRVAIYVIGDNAAFDLNVGIANGTHASDADAITESLFLHFDNSLDIKAESDDGTTEVNATDTTVDAVDDTYFDFRFDCRDLANIKIYINGVRVLSATTFKLDAATGPLKLLLHMEKSADDSPGECRVSHLAVRATDLAS